MSLEWTVSSVELDQCEMWSNPCDLRLRVGPGLEVLKLGVSQLGGFLAVEWGVSITPTKSFQLLAGDLRAAESKKGAPRRVSVVFRVWFSEIPSNRKSLLCFPWVSGTSGRPKFKTQTCSGALKHPKTRLGPPARCPFSPLFWLGGFPY